MSGVRAGRIHLTKAVDINLKAKTRAEMLTLTPAEGFLSSEDVWILPEEIKEIRECGLLTQIFTERAKIDHSFYTVETAEDILRDIELLRLPSGTKFEKCQHCGQQFLVGEGGKRRDARFCSDEHRVAFNSLKRKKI